MTRKIDRKILETPMWQPEKLGVLIAERQFTFRRGRLNPSNVKARMVSP
jgi:hypothetical protein